MIETPVSLNINDEFTKIEIEFLEKEINRLEFLKKNIPLKIFQQRGFEKYLNSCLTNIESYY